MQQLGPRSYWHEVPCAPVGDPMYQLAELTHLFDENWGRIAGKWPEKNGKRLRELHLRGMALELAVCFSQSGQALPEQLVSLLAEMLKLPPEFPSDPPSVFVHGRVGGREGVHRSSKDVASFLDRRFYVEHGELMPLARLSREVGEILQIERGPSRASLGRWRGEPDYQLFVRGLPEPI